MDGWRHPAVTQGDGPPAVFYRRAPESTSKISIKAPRVGRVVSSRDFPLSLHSFSRSSHIRNQGGSGVERMLSQTGDQGLAALLDRCRHKVLARRPRPLARAIFSCLLRRDASRQERRTYAIAKGWVYVGSWLQSTYAYIQERRTPRSVEESTAVSPPRCRLARARVSDVNHQIEFPA